jgi:threonine/homoserine/homoserine lactone efflux protein
LLQNIATFVLTAIFISIVPGQGMAMVLRQGLMSGAKVARLSILGNSTGLVVWTLASAIGLSAIFRVSPIAYQALKWAGVAYLVFIAIQTLWSLRSSTHNFDFEAGETQSAGKAFRVGFLTNITNAKAMVFALAFLPQYVPADFNLTLGIVIFGVIWISISTSWYLLIVAAIKKANVWLQRPRVRRGLTAASGVGIFILALGLVIAPTK